MQTKKYEQFWEKRSRRYEKLQWAIKGGYLKAFLHMGDFGADDVVLDIGTGTGIIAHTISPFVKKVIGIDISKGMLAHALEHRVGNEEFQISDARRLEFPDNTFGKITARMVFHHILEGTQTAMDECFRILKQGGKMVFSEGVPPSEHTRSFYIEMFKLKEERLTFREEDLLNLMKNSGFKRIHKETYWMRQASIKNWLENSGIDKSDQDKIMDMHRNMDEQGKQDYNMKIKDQDCLIDMKFIILVGEKG